MFGIEFGVIDWTAVGLFIVGSFATIRSIINAVKIGSNTVRSFAITKVNNAQAEMNNKIDGLQLHFENKLNIADAKIIELEQKLNESEQAVIDYKNQIRSILDNA